MNITFILGIIIILSGLALIPVSLLLDLNDKPTHPLGIILGTIGFWVGASICIASLI